MEITASCSGLVMKGQIEYSSPQTWSLCVCVSAFLLQTQKWERGSLARCVLDEIHLYLCECVSTACSSFCWLVVRNRSTMKWHSRHSHTKRCWLSDKSRQAWAVHENSSVATWGSWGWDKTVALIKGEQWWSSLWLMILNRKELCYLLAYNLKLHAYDEVDQSPC